MNQYITYAKKFLGMLSSTIFLSVFNFIFFTSLSLLLSSNTFGEFSYYYSLIFFLLPFIELGTTTLLLSNNDKTIEKNIIALLNVVILMSLLISLVLVFANLTYSLIVLNIVGLILFQFIQSSLIKSKYIDKQIFLSWINGLFKIIVAPLILFMDSADKESQIIIILVVLLFANVIPFFLYYRQTNYKFLIKGFLSHFLWKNLKWIMLSGFLATLLVRLDQFIIGSFLDKEILGSYMISIQWLTIVSLVSNTLLKYSFAETSNISADNYYKFINNKQNKINLILLISFTLFLLTAVFLTNKIYDGNPIIKNSLLILSIGFFFSIKYNLHSILLYKIKQTEKLFTIQIYQLLIQVGLILIFLNLFEFYIFPIAFSVIRVFGYFYIKKQLPVYIVKHNQL